MKHNDDSTKARARKLALRTETLRQLDPKDLGNAAGGAARLTTHCRPEKWED
jgi:hypothetical protein